LLYAELVDATLIIPVDSILYLRLVAKSLRVQKERLCPALRPYKTSD